MVDGAPNKFAAGKALERLGTDLCGRYRIDALIGMGGMSSVYSGRHRNGHPVAIKVLDKGFRGCEADQSIRREARLANTIDHRVVVPVIDDDVAEDGSVFLVMPLLRGETLRARARRLGGKLPATEVVSIAADLLGALAKAHVLGIVHRDLKPENVFVTTEGDVRLLDFGIGRSLDDDGDVAATRPGRTVGTPAFMAPEQARGRRDEIDGRTDLWGVGATMYTLLSGRFVHESPTVGETTAFAATRPARPLGEVAPHVPGALRDVVDRALSFRREDRWGDADSMARAIADAYEQSFGRAVSSLPPLTVPCEAVPEGPDAVPTETAAAAKLGASGVVPDARSTFLLSPTTTSPIAASPRANAPRESTRRVGTALRAMGLVGGVAALAIGTFIFFGPKHAPEPTRQSPATLTQASESIAGEPTATPTDSTPPASLAVTRLNAVPQTTVAKPAAVPPSPAVARSPAPTGRPSAQKAPAPPPRKATIAPQCDPGYSLDSSGHHIYKPECL